MFSRTSLKRDVGNLHYHHSMMGRPMNQTSATSSFSILMATCIAPRRCHSHLNGLRKRSVSIHSLTLKLVPKHISRVHVIVYMTQMQLV